MNFLTIISLLLNLYLIGAVVVPKLKLNTGYEIPAIGLGTYNSTKDVAINVVKDALSVGYRHIDTAQLYGNEKDIGVGLAQSIKAGVVKRGDVFITSKIAPTNMTRAKAFAAVKQSLQALNTPYLDLVLLHWPEGDFADIYRGLEDAFEKKLVRSIGVSNFEVKQLVQLLNTTRVKPALNQIEIHPKNTQKETVDFCHNYNIVVTGFSPLGTGSLIKDSTLVSIGKIHSKSSAQVMIRWQIQRNLVVIPKSTHKQRLIENINVFDFTLTEAEMQTINKLH